MVFFKCPTQESHSKFSIINQKDKDFWEDRAVTGITHNRPLGPRQKTDERNIFYTWLDISLSGLVTSVRSFCSMLVQVQVQFGQYI